MLIPSNLQTPVKWFAKASGYNPHDLRGRPQSRPAVLKKTLAFFDGDSDPKTARASSKNAGEGRK